MSIRTNWTLEEVETVYHKPLIDLMYEAATIHRQYHDPREVQVCRILSIKTGGCPEDCKYCTQSSRYQTDVDAQPMLDIEAVLEDARKAKAQGCTRFCMGAAWRGVRDSAQFDRVLEMVKEVNGMGLEVCVTLGLVTEEQAKKLKEAGLYAYNHNLDSGEEFYKTIITTRTYQDRLETLGNLRKAGVSVCCGGIIGLGETDKDRIDLLHTLATLPEHPESVPVNALVAMPGTPLEDQQRVSAWEMVRMIATARILMPKAIVRVTAGREYFSNEEQALFMLSGGNSMFVGENHLTERAKLPAFDKDKELLSQLGMHGREPFKRVEDPVGSHATC